MPEFNKDLEGKKFRKFKYTIERGKLHEFLRAIRETNPLYWDPEVARKEGYEDTPVPPTYSTLFTFWGYPEIYEDMNELGIDIAHMLHMKEEYTYHKPLYPGQTVTTQPTVVAVKTGRNRIMTFQSIFTNEKGEDCLEVNYTTFITPDEE